ncbi:unnamed protein product [Candidula unifasciata]|uniref:Uncharacterized protein n=1 Tax=Candidula unifasciata TaxID=100452 RepID=A0A8S4A0F7_9EUPU|nr:unnamed protein product [Candidula unifasciata]
MDKLTGSAKRPSTVVTRRRGAKIVKPVARLQVPVAAVNPFVPTVTSTKNIAFNFSKTPVALKTPAPAANEASPTPRKPAVTASARKSVGTGNRATPFIFTGNNAAHNITVNSQKKSFDLKASLAKPLSWKPHTGRLQPLDINKPQPTAVVAPVKQERPSRQVMASKTRPVNTKDVRRVQQVDRRNNQKYIDMMKRRGLLA